MALGWHVGGLSDIVALNHHPPPPPPPNPPANKPLTRNQSIDPLTTPNLSALQINFGVFFWDFFLFFEEYYASV